jgi:hypothetical protein
LKNLVRKHSRKLTAAVCLVLAVKFNEVPKDSRLDALQVPLPLALSRAPSLSRWLVLSSPVLGNPSALLPSLAAPAHRPSQARVQPWSSPSPPCAR